MPITEVQRREQNHVGISDLRYPQDLPVDSTPFMTFSTQRPVYDNLGSALRSNPTGESATLYVPAGYSVSDSIRYETAEGGLIGYVIDRFADGSITDISPGEIADIAKQNIAGVSATIAGGAAAVGGNLGSGALTGLLTSSALGGEIQNRVSRREGKTQNPREYMMFQSPEMRSFSFNFSMIPQSETEANDAIRIVRFFRRASYPELSANGFAYLFPDLFKISFGNNDSMIRIPEVACTGVEVTYNSNTQSFFTRGNIPVQIDLGVSFQELKAITRDDIDEGF